MNNSSFSFKTILVTGLKKGITYSAIFAFITTGWFVTLVSVASNESTLNIFAQRSMSEYYGFILTGIFVGVILTGLAFIFVGFPLMIIPAILGSSLLTYWLYKDFNKNVLSLQNSRIKGVFLGGLFGLAPALLLIVKNAIQVDRWTLLFSEDGFIDFGYRIGFVALPILFGGLAGFLLGTHLTSELGKGVARIEPKEDYFSIDWEALQKEEQQNNLKPDTSSHDT